MERVRRELGLVEFDAKTLRLRLPKLSLCTISSDWRWRFGAWLVFLIIWIRVQVCLQWCSIFSVVIYIVVGFSSTGCLLLMSLSPHFEPCVWRWFALSIRL